MRYWRLTNTSEVLSLIYFSISNGWSLGLKQRSSGHPLFPGSDLWPILKLWRSESLSSSAGFSNDVFGPERRFSQVNYSAGVPLPAWSCSHQSSLTCWSWESLYAREGPHLATLKSYTNEDNGEKLELARPFVCLSLSPSLQLVFLHFAHN